MEILLALLAFGFLGKKRGGSQAQASSVEAPGGVAVYSNPALPQAVEISNASTEHARLADLITDYKVKMLKAIEGLGLRAIVVGPANAPAGTVVQNSHRITATASTAELFRWLQIAYPSIHSELNVSWEAFNLELSKSLGVPDLQMAVNMANQAGNDMLKVLGAFDSAKQRYKAIEAEKKLLQGYVQGNVPKMLSLIHYGLDFHYTNPGVPIGADALTNIALEAIHEQEQALVADSSKIGPVLSDRILKLAEISNNPELDDTAVALFGQVSAELGKYIAGLQEQILNQAYFYFIARAGIKIYGDKAYYASPSFAVVVQGKMVGYYLNVGVPKGSTIHVEPKPFQPAYWSAYLKGPDGARLDPTHTSYRASAQDYMDPNFITLTFASEAVFKSATAKFQQAIQIYYPHA